MMIPGGMNHCLEPLFPQHREFGSTMVFRKRMDGKRNLTVRFHSCLTSEPALNPTLPAEQTPRQSKPPLPLS